MVENILLINESTKYELELDKVTTPNFILDSADWGVIESTHNEYKYVNQIGVSVLNTVLGTRSIEITGWIIADNEIQMSDRKSFLNRLINPQDYISLIYGEYTIKFKPDNTVKYSISSKENNEIISRFKINGTAHDPLFSEKAGNKISAASTKPMFHFPLVIPKVAVPPTYPNAGVIFGYRQPSLLFGVTNKGAVTVGMEIVFLAKGTLTNPSIYNVDTQEYFKINKTMIAGEKITVNTIIGQKKIQGYLNGVTTNYFKYRDLDSKWLQLTIGDNLFRYNADSNIGNLEVYIYYNNKYLEVQQCY